VCAEDRPLLAAIEKLINRKIEVRIAEGFEPERGRPAPAAQESTPRGEPRAGRKGRSEGEGRKGRSEGEGRKPQPEARPPRHRGRREEERAPRYANSPAATTSGDSGGMDFSKPYEPSPSAAAAVETPERPATRKTGQAIPALFRRKAA